MNILLDIKHNMHNRGYTFFKNEREYLSKNEVLCVKMDIDLALNNSLGFAFVIFCELEYASGHDEVYFAVSGYSFGGKSSIYSWVESNHTGTGTTVRKFPHPNLS